MVRGGLEVHHYLSLTFFFYMYKSDINVIWGVSKGLDLLRGELSMGRGFLPTKLHLLFLVVFAKLHCYSLVHLIVAKHKVHVHLGRNIILNTLYSQRTHKGETGTC